MAIPKIIHYCWMSKDAFPREIKECIDSWHKLMPDYEIKLWNSENFDVNICQYTKEAMACKKYAFVSDYIRLYALYAEGGIYLDSDVKAIKTFDSLLDERAFIGFESGGRTGPWLIASEAGNPLIKELLDYYTEKSFYKDDGEMDQVPNTVPVTNTLIEHGLLPDNRVQKLENITIYPEEYFCPKNPWNGNVNITNNTIAMHLFMGAWNDIINSERVFISSIDKHVINFIKSIGNDDKQIIIYGIGIVGRNVLEELKKYNNIGIECIFVTKRDNGWTSIDEIPIIEIDKSDNIDKKIPVLISTISKYHEEIEKTLNKYGYSNIFCLGR